MSSNPMAFIRGGRSARPVSRLPSAAVLLLCLGLAGAAAAPEPEDLTACRTIGARIAALAGPGWEVSIEKAEHLLGWEGKVGGYTLSFRHRTRRLQSLGDVPAMFRFTVLYCPWPSAKLDPRPGNPDPDLAMGWAEYTLWFCGPETYGAACPKEWAALLAAVRKEYGIPEPVDGVQCRLSATSQVVHAGEPFALMVHTMNVSGKTLAILDSRARVPETLRVLDAAGRPVACRIESATREPFRGGVRDIPVGGSYGAALSVSGKDAPLPAGLYTAQAEYLLDDKGKSAHAQPLRLRVVPPGFLAIGLAPAGTVRFDAAGCSVPMAVSLALPPGEKVEEFSLQFTAIVNSRKIGLGSRLWGTVEPKVMERLAAQVAASNGGRVPLGINLADVHWSDPIASDIQSSAFDHYVKPGETWEVTAAAYGKVDGLRFLFSSETLRVARP